MFALHMNSAQADVIQIVEHDMNIWNICLYILLCMTLQKQNALKCVHGGYFACKWIWGVRTENIYGSNYIYSL